MNFNDFITPSDSDYKIMKQNYDRILENETSDLQEIHKKMVEQRNNLVSHNIDSRYDRIILKLNSNIMELSQIIANNNSNIFYKSPLLPLSRENNKYSPKIAQTDSVAISPIRSKEEIEAHENFNNLPANNQPNDDVGIRPSPAMPNNMPATTSKRNSPMQGNLISNLIKQFNLNWKRAKKQVVSDDFHRNIFHNIGIMHKKCEPSDIIIGTQLDIIRLLILYIALRPNCKYLSRIANITNDQFESLLIIQS